MERERERERRRKRERERGGGGRQREREIEREREREREREELSLFKLLTMENKYDRFEPVTTSMLVQNSTTMLLTLRLNCMLPSQLPKVA